MTITRQQIGDTLLKIQSQFLSEPHLSLTAEEIRQRFGSSLMLSRTVLDLLVDASVLEKSVDGVYSRRMVNAAARQFHPIRRTPRTPARTAA